jgi:hypothetical protein
MQKYALYSSIVLLFFVAAVEASVQTESMESRPLCANLDSPTSHEAVPASDGSQSRSSAFCSLGMQLPTIDAWVKCAAARSPGPFALCDLAEAAFQRQMLPDPATIAVWSLIGLCWSGVSCWRRRRSLSVRDGNWDRSSARPHRNRPPWPDHVRTRILEIIERGNPR